MAGSARPPGMGPGSRSGCFGLPNWVLGSTHGLRASAWALGAGIEVLLEAGGQSPGRVAGVTPWWLLLATAASGFRNSTAILGTRFLLG